MKPIEETHPSLTSCFDVVDIHQIQKHTVDKAVLKEWVKEFFEKFDEFACVKNDKWYKEYKKQKYQELGVEVEE